MYFRFKERKNKKESFLNDHIMIDIYLCTSKRIDGKVKNTQQYLFCIKKSTLEYLDINSEEFEKHYNLLIEFNHKKQLEKLSNVDKLKLKFAITDKIKEYRKLKEEEQAKRKENFSSKLEDDLRKLFGITETRKDTKEYHMQLELIKLGYRQLTKKYHPDAGGSQEDFVLLQEVKKKLENM